MSTAPVELGPIDRFPVGTVRMVHAAGRRLVVAHTAEDGVRVTDSACPHEGYGLAQGELSDGVLTCAWHNWKYRMADGTCLVGEEDLRLYPARVRDGRVWAEVSDPSPGEARPRLLASLRRGLDDGYVGQMARDIVRLLRADADPVQLIWEAVAWGAPRAEFGFGHALASLTDCLTLAERARGDERALPVVQAFAGIAEVERRRPLRPRPDPLPHLPERPGAAFRAAIDAEDLDGAEALLRAALAAGFEADRIRPWFTSSVSDHHLSYGHGAIYVQKAFTLLERLGWDRADTVLAPLVPAVGYGTREDKLPYMRGFVRAVADLDLAALADADPEPGWSDDGRLVGALLGRDARRVATEASRAIGQGAGVEGLLDTVVEAGAHRLLRYDPAAEVGSDGTDFGWLDLSHVLTYAAACRWAWRSSPGPDTARLALWSAFQAHYAGRRGYAEVGPEDAGPEEAGPEEAGPAAPDPSDLCRRALEDRAGSFIVAAHLVKTSAAAVSEAEATGSDRPLAAAARLVEAPRRERFVALNVRKAIDLADGRVPD